MVKSIPGQAKSLRSAEQGELDSRLRQCVDSTPCSTCFRTRYLCIYHHHSVEIMAFFSRPDCMVYGSLRPESSSRLRHAIPHLVAFLGVLELACDWLL